MKVKTILNLYVEKIIKEANNKEDYQDACYFIYTSLLNNYGWDKAQEILEYIEKKYNLKLEY